jgi:hypothetical protein
MLYNNRYFSVFLTQHRSTLEYIYYNILKEHNRQTVDFKTFASFAFYRTSPKQIKATHELR